MRINIIEQIIAKVVTKEDLQQVLTQTEYKDCTIKRILEVKQFNDMQVVFKVEFVDEMGSFGGVEPVGNVYVACMPNGKLIADF